MPLLSVLLILGQSIMTASIPDPPQEIQRISTRSHAAGKNSPSPTPTPQVRITIVNATCLPAISLTTGGDHLPLDYPEFPQGEWTGNQPLTNTEVHYLARTTNGMLLGEKSFRFQPISSQMLVLSGDPSPEGAPDNSTDSGNITKTDSSTSFGITREGIRFGIYPVETPCRDPSHYRIVNAMPSEAITLRIMQQGNQPPQILGVISPGKSLLLTGQGPCVEWVAEIGGVSYPVIIQQEGAVANCLIPFFLRNGKPDFVRVFETP